MGKRLTIRAINWNLHRSSSPCFLYEVHKCRAAVDPLTDKCRVCFTMRQICLGNIALHPYFKWRCLQPICFQTFLTSGSRTLIVSKVPHRFAVIVATKLFQNLNSLTLLFARKQFLNDVAQNPPSGLVRQPPIRPPPIYR